MRRIMFLFFAASALTTTACDKKDTRDEKKDEGGDKSTLYVSVTPNEKQVRSTSGSFNIIVTSNTAWIAEAKGDNTGWIKMAAGSATPSATIEGEKTQSVAISYAKLDEGVSREVEIVFSVKDKPAVTAKLEIIQTDQTFTNPLAQNLPDPWIIKHNGLYYFCKAHGSGTGQHINISASEKLTHINSTKSVWTGPTDNGSIKPWNTSHFWAPELHYIDGKWYVYYTAGRPSEETGGFRWQRSGVLECDSQDPLTGTWTDKGMLYTGDDEYVQGMAITGDNTSYAIDLTVAKIKGQLYAIWSGGPKADGWQATYIAKMSNPTTIVSKRVKLSEVTEPWEMVTSSKVQEGQVVIENAGKIFIIYSCNHSTTDNYRLAYLMLENEDLDPMVPANWKKSPAPIFMRSDRTQSSSGIPGVNGVGHCSFTKSPDDTEDWIVYHAKNYQDGGYSTGRAMHIKRVKWHEDGTPNFGTPPGYGEPQVIPSGQRID